MFRVRGLEMWEDPIVKEKINPYSKGRMEGTFSSARGEKGSPSDREEKLGTGVHPEWNLLQKA